MSVPPESDPSRTSSETDSYTQSQVVSGSGEPVTRMDFKAEKPWWTLGTTPDRSIMVRTPAPVPKNVALFLATSSKDFCGLPKVGAPSYVMMVAPVRRIPTDMFHTIQVVATAKYATSAGPSPACKPRALRNSSVTPPWECTMPLGLPVVPDE